MKTDRYDGNGQGCLFDSPPPTEAAAFDSTLTPLWLIARMGRFDLDPCGFSGHPSAERLIVLPEDGLAAEWAGRVWLNPPYSDPGPWLERLAAHGNGMALVLASTDTNWYHQHVAGTAAGLLFVRGRPRFLRPDRTEVGLMRASLLVAYGRANSDSLRAAGIDGHFISTGEGASRRSP